MSDGDVTGRALIHSGRGRSLQTGALSRLRRRGWCIQSAADPRDVMRIVQRQPDRPFAAVLEIDDAFDEAELAEFGPALAASNVGWVAAVDAGRLHDPLVRRLISDYCYDYVTLPCPDAVIDTVLGHVFGMAALACRSSRRPGAVGLDGIIGESPAMRLLARALSKAAMTEAPVFIDGQTGTGKELAAQALHRLSRRASKPFVAINCGAIPHSLMQSELFGYERGAFTGAQQRKLGRIEMANGGTLFLDEIGDLPMESQASLLRFLQQGSFERLGGHDLIPVDVRIVSATHHDLQEAIREGRFRADLYHRLCVLKLQQPPLCERGGDIDLIAEHALRQYAGEAQRVIKGFAPCARQAMHRYAWPGNVRELINRVRQAVVMAEGRLLTAADLGLDAHVAAATPTLEDIRAQATRDAIERALQRNRGRLVDTAKELDVSRVTLYRMMLRLGLRDEDVAASNDASHGGDDDRPAGRGVAAPGGLGMHA